MLVNGVKRYLRRPEAIDDDRFWLLFYSPTGGFSIFISHRLFPVQCIAMA
jgi:hypothetical protein